MKSCPGSGAKIDIASYGLDGWGAGCRRCGRRVKVEGEPGRGGMFLVEHEMEEPMKLRIRVTSNRSPVPVDLQYDESVTVGAVADEVAPTYGLIADGSVSLSRNGFVLHREETLAEAGVKHHDTLEIADIGGGV